MGANPQRATKAVSTSQVKAKASPRRVGRKVIQTVPDHVFKIAEARDNLSSIVVQTGSDRPGKFVVGSRGEPTMMCISYERYKPLLGHGNRSEKLALLIADELLPDAPQHIRAPALEELSQLPMGDLAVLWGIRAFPLSERASRELKKQMQNPQALERLAKRARISEVLSEAEEAGLYDAISDFASSVVDEDE